MNWILNYIKGLLITKANLNRGILITPQKNSDWIMGAETGIIYQENTDGQWNLYLPTNEKQFNNKSVFDTLACVSFSALNTIEIQVNWMVKNGKIPQDKIQALTDLGFFDSNGLFNASDRFTAKMSGTTKQGNSAGNVWNSIRHDGILPEKDYIDDATSFDDYYKEIPQDLKDKAKKILDIFDFQYEQVAYGNFGIPDANAIKTALKQAPLQIFTAVCPRFFGDQQDSEPIVQRCEWQVSHATTLYGYGDIYWKDFDSYSDNFAPNNYTHELAMDYAMPYVFKGVVSLRQSIQQPKPTHYVFTKIMKYGDKNQDVVYLQDELKHLGYFPLTVPSTGYFGTITAQAVIKLQLANGIIPSSSFWTSAKSVQVGPKTLQFLNSN